MIARVQSAAANARRLAEAHFWDALRYALSLVSSQIHVLLLPLYTRKLSVIEYGQFEIALSFIGLASVILGMGLPSLASARFFKTANRPETTVRIAMVFLVTALPVCAVASLPPVSRTVSEILLNDVDLVGVTVLLIWIAFFLFLKNLLLDLFIVGGRSGAYLSFEAAYTFVFLGSLSVYAAVFSIDVLGIILAQFVGLVPILARVAYDLYRCRNVYNLRRVVLTLDYVRTVRIAIPICASGICAWIVDLSDRWLLLKLGKVPEEVAYYALAYKLAALAPMAINFIFGKIYIRRYYQLLSFAAEDGDKVLEVYSDYSRYARYYGIFIVSMYMFFYAILFATFDIVFPPRYQVSLIVLPYIAVGLLFKSLIFFYTPILMFFERTPDILLTSVSAAVTNLVLNVVLIPLYGMYGAAIATAIAFAVSITLVRHLAARHLSRYRAAQA